MATNAITGLTYEQEQQRAQQAHNMGQGFFGGIANAVGPFLNPLDPTNYLGFGGKAAKGLFALTAGMKAPDAEAIMLGKVAPEMAARANQLAAMGVSEGRILQETGLSKVPTSPTEFTWGRQVSDAGASINQDVLNKIKTGLDKRVLSNKSAPIENIQLKDLLSHPELYKTYPEIGNISIEKVNGFQKMGGVKGFYDSASNILGVSGLNPYMTKPEQVASQLKDHVSTLLHEAQHAVQTVEKWPRGGNVGEFTLPSTKAAAEQVKWANKSLEDSVKAAFVSAGNPAPYNVPRILKLTAEYKEKGPSVIKHNLESEREAVLFLANSDKANDILKTYDKVQRVASKVDTRNTQAFNKYENLAGEAQSRAVQRAYEAGTSKVPLPAYYTKENKISPPMNLIYKDPFAPTIK